MDVTEEQRELEVRRRVGVELLRQGFGVREVARKLGVSPTSVARWRDAASMGGIEALKAKPKSEGGKPTLTDDELAKLRKYLRKGPQIIDAKRWTSTTVRTLILRAFHVEFHRAHVGRILKALGWVYVVPAGSYKNRGRWVPADSPEAVTARPTSRPR